MCINLEFELSRSFTTFDYAVKEYMQCEGVVTIESRLNVVFDLRTSEIKKSEVTSER